MEINILKVKRSVHQRNICRRLVIVKVHGLSQLVNFARYTFHVRYLLFAKSVADLYIMKDFGQHSLCNLNSMVLGTNI